MFTVGDSKSVLPDAKVSSHYLVEEDGRVFRLVAEERRAWHAGVSFWRGRRNVNGDSIGIEIVNPGHEFGYRAFPEAQVAAVIDLIADIRRDYATLYDDSLVLVEARVTRARNAAARKAVVASGNPSYDMSSAATRAAHVCAPWSTSNAARVGPDPLNAWTTCGTCPLSSRRCGTPESRRTTFATKAASVSCPRAMHLFKSCKVCLLRCSRPTMGGQI